MQHAPDRDPEFVISVARACAEVSADVFVNIGDWWDFPSLSKYDKPGSRRAVGTRYIDDFDAGTRALDLMHGEWERLGYSPELHFTMGNHETRCDRALEHDARLDGVISSDHLPIESFGYQRHAFCDEVEVDGVTYSHVFPLNASGGELENGAYNAPPTASAQLNRLGKSCVAGHVHRLDMAFRLIRHVPQFAVQCGACYLHDEPYRRGKQNYLRGAVIIHEAGTPEATPSFVSIQAMVDAFSDASARRRKKNFLAPKAAHPRNVAPRSRQPRRNSRQVANLVSEAVAGGARTQKAIRDETGLAPSTVHGALKRLGIIL